MNSVSADAVAGEREWTVEEVAKHNTKEDCFVIVHGTFPVFALNK
jgi:cytochrome b involved in lipid metabolism